MRAQVIAKPLLPQRPLFATATELSLMERGYMPAPEVPEVEAEIAAEAECEGCGEIGLAAVAYFRGESLRCVMVCAHCTTGREL